MELVENQSMVKNLLMKILNYVTIVQIFYQWQMLVQTQMDHNFLLQQVYIDIKKKYLNL